MHPASADQAHRVARLERRLRGLVGLNVAIALLAGVAVLGGFATPNRVSTVAEDSLRVHELLVLDAAGTVRLRLSANMPDAVINGRTVHRPERAAGVMLYDDSGQERGGYVTFAPSRSVALTLDTRRNQVAAFVAESIGGAAAALFQGNDRLEIRASKTTSSGLYVWKNGSLVVQLPELSEDEEAKVCTEMKDEIRAAERSHQKVPDAQVRTACELHMSGKACRKCLSSAG